MGLSKYLERIKRMDQMIRMKSTGTPESLAEKLDISRSGVYEYLKYMKALGAPIEYCRFRNTFYYTSEVKLFIQFMSN